MPVILVTNDDGVHSAGIHALADALPTRRRDRRRAGGGVERDWPRADPRASAAARAPARRCLLRRRHADRLRQPRREHVLRELPDLVVSGINKGYNLGDDVTYSGTVGGRARRRAARRAGDCGVARSTDRRTARLRPRGRGGAHCSPSASCAVGLPPRTLLNVNVPPRPAARRTRSRSRASATTSRR